MADLVSVGFDVSMYRRLGEEEMRQRRLEEQLRQARHCPCPYIKPYARPRALAMKEEERWKMS